MLVFGILELHFSDVIALWLRQSAPYPGYRGLGLAGFLVDKAVGFAKERGLRAVFLEVRTDNVAAVSLYEKKGFVKRGVKPGYYGDGADAYSMVFPLPK